jgi:hypothetical protein
MISTRIGPTILTTIAALGLISACQSNRPSPIDEPSTQEGLVRVETKAVNAAYRRPDALLTGYNKLLLQPVDVQFAKNWKPDSSGSALYQMNRVDREKIKSDLAQGFADIVRQELGKGGYSLVTEPAQDVLEVRAAIVNLYITAPDVSMQTGGRTRVYTTDAGQMTLILELHDSVTGELLARAYDRRSASRGTWTWTTSVSNSADARRIMSSWASALRSALDASRAAAA